MPRLLRALLPAAALGLVVFALAARSPFLLRWRSLLPLALIAGAAAAGALVARPDRRRGALAAVCLGAVAAGVWGEARFEAARARVLAAGPELAVVGRHLVVGFRRFEEVEPLAARGAVGGIFLGAHNVRGLEVAEVRARIDRLQASRRRAGLPPLVVMADQEGGNVERLSPPLPRMPRLASLAGSVDAEAQAWAYGAMQGEGLAAIGVNVNLGPVVDVPAAAAPLLDPYSRISTRAISFDPEEVALIAAGYARGLESQGVRATLKHFPGLGRAGADTHFFRTELPASLRDLEEADWRPYREALAGTGSLVMVGHVVVPALDPERVASVSPAVVQGALRGRLEHRGLVVTDDLCMAPVAHGPGGIGGGAVAALNAGVDLLLVSYDRDQYFPVMDALLEARRDGTLDPAALERSASRLERERTGALASRR